MMPKRTWLSEARSRPVARLPARPVATLPMKLRLDCTAFILACGGMSTVILTCVQAHYLDCSGQRWGGRNARCGCLRGCGQRYVRQHCAAARAECAEFVRAG